MPRPQTSVRTLQRTAATLLACALWAGCGGPCGPFPGGRLAGMEFPFPSQGFAAYREIETVAVEVGGEAPYSVQTWAIVLGDEFYVPADFFNPGKRWPFMALENPAARIRIGEEIFEGSLHRVTDEERIQALRIETARKYEIEEGTWAARVEVWWFRFDPRGASAITEADRVSPHNAGSP